MIYFIQNAKTLAIKIGYSTDPVKRLGLLQVASSDPLVLLAMFVGERDKERQLHERYKDQRIKGEWFDGSIIRSDYLAVFDSPATRSGYFTADGLCDMWHVNRDTIDRLCRDVVNPLPYVKVGEYVLFRRTEVAAWLKLRKQMSKGPNRRIKRGRPAAIWWHAKRGWFTTIDDRQVNLGPDREKAEQAFYRLRPELMQE